MSFFFLPFSSRHQNQAAAAAASQPASQTIINEGSLLSE